MGYRGGGTGLPGDGSHGTHVGYVIHRREGEDACGPCKEAHARYVRERARINRPPSPAPVPGPVVEGAPHGTSSGYGWWKCRCVECRASNSRRSAEWRKRIRDAAPIGYEIEIEGPPEFSPEQRRELAEVARRWVAEHQAVEKGKKSKGRRKGQ